MGLLHSEQTIKYFRAAIWVLDYCLTFEHEVRLFTSKGRWSITTVTFIVARYSPIIWIASELYATLGPQSVETCLTTHRTAASSLVFVMAATEGLLLMRILALWYGNWSIKRFLIGCYLVVVISIFSCIGVAWSHMESVCEPTSSQSSVEDATKVEHLVMGLFVNVALFELAAIVVILYHSILLRSTGIRTVGKLVATLSKGSLLYALSLLAISVANIVAFSLPISSMQSDIIDVFQGVLHSVMASRILFELRDADQGGKLSSEFTSGASSHMQFASQTIPMTVLHDRSNV